MLHSAPLLTGRPEILIDGGANSQRPLASGVHAVALWRPFGI